PDTTVSIDGALLTNADGPGAFDSGRRFFSADAWRTAGGAYTTYLRCTATNGYADASFASSGTFTSTAPATSPSEFPRGVAVAANDSVFLLSVAGYANSPMPGVVRLTHVTSAGAIDTGYGSGGTVEVASGLASHGAIATEAGPLLVGPQGDALVVIVDPSRADPVFMRHVTATGAIDAGFGVAGDAALPLSPREGFSVITDAAGRILVVGVEPSTDGVASALRIVRLTSDGRLDASFATGGVARVAAGISDYFSHP